ncbi:MAG TPA: sigma-54 dependent transcriptional regulator [Gemmatimonadales bacterium]
MTLILVVDDVPAMAEQYAYDLKRLGGFDTRAVTGGKEALDILAREVVGAVILDLEMPGVDGFEVLKALSDRGSDVPVIVYTGTGNFERCVRAVQAGAYGFIDKNEPMERVLNEVQRALERRRLSGEVADLKRRLADDDSAMVGSSKPMLALKELIAKLAPVPSAVLIQGESGTGKELVAGELHRLSPHANEPFIAVNAAALPNELVESELFGHERGSFTGAVATRQGAFEAAGKGTLFLDEVGELPPAQQAKLLRVLEQREIRRVGGTKDIPVKARVVAATNRVLADDVKAGRFRQDLFYRLNVHIVRVPPLRERASDLPDLTAHLLKGIATRLGVKTPRLAPEALGALMAYDWRRNNVRELKNVLERMVIFADGSTLNASTIPPEIRGNQDPVTESTGTFADQKADAERRIVLEALERTEWQIGKTAKALGLADHASLLKIMRRLGIQKL